MNNGNNNIGNQIPNNNQNTNPATAQFQTEMNNVAPQNQVYEQINSKPKVNKNAIISIITSIVSFFIFGWLAAVSVGLGIRALSEIKKNNESGKVLAIIGMVIGCISLALYFYTLIVLNS